MIIFIVFATINVDGNCHRISKSHFRLDPCEEGLSVRTTGIRIIILHVCQSKFICRSIVIHTEKQLTAGRFLVAITRQNSHVVLRYILTIFHPSDDCGYFYVIYFSINISVSNIINLRAYLRNIHSYCPTAFVEEHLSAK